MSTCVAWHDAGPAPAGGTGEPGELVEDRHTRRPAHVLGQAIYLYCFERGLIFSQRRQGSVLRFVPPMSTTDAQLDRAAQLLDDAFAAALAGRRA